MTRIINYLFPSFLLDSTPYPSTSYHLINITINDECFFIEYTSTSLSTEILELLFLNIKQALQQLFPKKVISLYNIPNITPDHLPKKTIYFTFENEKISIALTLEFLNYMSNELSFTHYYKASSIFDLHLELFRFRPYFMTQAMWLKLSEKKMRDLFYHMITKQLASPKMFALFFKKIPIPNFQCYFSSSIASQIQNEYDSLLKKENPQILDCIYYIIERNLLIYLNTTTSEYSQFIHYYHKTILQNTLPTFNLNNFPTFIHLTHKSNFSISLQKIPYKSIVSFLSFSDPINTNILKQGFSEEGWKRLQEDLYSPNLDINDSIQFIYYLAQILSHCETFESLIQQFIKKERHWEFLAREADLRELLLCLNILPKKYLPNGIIRNIYEAYKYELIIFPNIEKISLMTAQQNTCTTIYYLYLMGYLL